MNISKIARHYNNNPLRTDDLDYLRLLTVRQQRIVSLIERIAVYGDSSYSTERELRSEVRMEAGLRWDMDAENFIEDKLSRDLPYWVRRWASSSRIEPHYESPRISVRDELRFENARVRVSAEVSTRETIAIAQAIANLMNAGR